MIYVRYNSYVIVWADDARASNSLPARASRLLNVIVDLNRKTRQLKS